MARSFPGPPCRQFRVLALDHVESADARGNVDAGGIGNFLRHFQPAILTAKSVAAMAN